MTPNQDLDRIATADLQRPPGTVLKGQFVEVWRSDKGKIKGMIVQTTTQTCTIKLPKYLRPMLVRELLPQDYVQVWAYPDEGRWRGVNVMPLPEPEVRALQGAIAAPPVTPPPATATQVCVQVCRKGKCYKQGGAHILQTLQAEVATNPDLSHVTVEGVGCMKACKHGPNLKLSPSGRVISGVTAPSALALIQQAR
ncbi:MAG TPA: (2Fe-2S) ferredoxin domain-containing protein [Candidatus Obscuribacterales bacterium]